MTENELKYRVLTAIRPYHDMKVSIISKATPKIIVDDGRVAYMYDNATEQVLREIDKMIDTAITSVMRRSIL